MKWFRKNNLDEMQELKLLKFRKPRFLARLYRPICGDRGTSIFIRP